MSTIATYPEPVLIPIPFLGTFWQGTAVTDTSAFVDEDDEPADPTTVSYQWQLEGRPPVLVTGGSITHVGTGAYRYAIDTTPLVGWVTVIWIGTDACQTRGPARFYVEALPS